MLYELALLAILASAAYGALWRIWLHPLSVVPGPLYASVSSIWLQYYTIRGRSCSAIAALHARYGPVVRIAPNQVDISDGDAIKQIYVDKGGFSKARNYAQFEIDGYAAMFSTLDNRDRAERLRTVMPVFSAAAVREDVHKLEACAAELVRRLRADRQSKGVSNLHNLARCYAIDSVTSYIFDKPYEALSEGDELSATPFIDLLISTAALFNSPNWLAKRIASIWMSFLNGKTGKSVERMDSWLKGAVSANVAAARSGEDDRSYVARLREAGLDEDKVSAECGDLVFAGTDSVGHSLAMILWRLAGHAEYYEKLEEELAQSAAQGETLQGLPILTGIIKESMRLSLANPVAFPRVVPEAGWTFQGYFMPAGTVVGTSSRELHFDRHIYPDPLAFNPERWTSASDMMNRNWFPFGKGSRICIARHLAMIELYVAVAAVVRSHVLRGAQRTKKHIRTQEYFNAIIENNQVEIRWSQGASQ